MTDLEQRLRRSLDDRVRELEPPPANAMAHRVISRRRRRAAVVALAASVAFVTLAASLLQTPRDDEELATAPAPLIGDPVPGLMAVVGSTVYDLGTSPPEEVAALPEGEGPATKAVLTDHGIVVAMGDQVERSKLLLVPLDGSDPITIAERTAGFAVDATGEEVAWARPLEAPIGARLFEAPLDDLDAGTQHDFEGFARVVGYSGSSVLLATGDGAGASAATWEPGRTVARLTYPGGYYGSAVTGYGPRALSLVTKGDGTCLALVGTIVLDFGDPCVAPGAATFSADGRSIAVAPVDPSETVFVLRTDGSHMETNVRAEPAAPVWLDDGFAVIAHGGSSVVRCGGMKDASCETVWEVDGQIAALVEPVASANAASRRFDLPPPPPRTAEPPTALVAVTPDGRLVVVERTTGRVLRQLAEHGDPTEPVEGEGPGPNVIDDVALSPDGEQVWYSECCEPAGGSLYLVPLDASADGLLVEFASGYAPVVSTDGRYVALTTITGAHIADTRGPDSRAWESETYHGMIQELGWSLDGTVMALRAGMPNEPGELVIVDPSSFRFGDELDAPDLDVRQLHGDRWALPAFDRQGQLVVAELDDATWRGRVIDSLTDEVLSSFDYGGRPIAQDFDPTGEWLLYVLADGDDGAGTVHWRGPDGSTGTIPGRYRTVSW